MTNTGFDHLCTNLKRCGSNELGPNNSLVPMPFVVPDLIDYEAWITEKTFA